MTFTKANREQTDELAMELIDHASELQDACSEHEQASDAEERSYAAERILEILEGINSANDRVLKLIGKLDG